MSEILSRYTLMTGKHLALIAFLIWEAWWAYDFSTAPNPDYEMRTVFELLMGLILPGLVAFAWLVVSLGQRRGSH